MPIFEVRVQEVHISTRRVVAEDETKAKELAGEAEEINSEYGWTVDPDEWAAPEKMSRGELIDEAECLAQRLVASGQISAFKEIFGDNMDVDISKLTDERLEHIYAEYVLED